jgi:circadian clock protein KaiC
MLSRNPARSGVAGLDDVLAGGFPRNRIHLVQGDPGVGKTTLALQFLLSGREAGEQGLYLTLSETEEELRDVAESHGWSLNGLHLRELAPTPEAVSSDENTLFHPADVGAGRADQGAAGSGRGARARSGW